MVFYLTWLAGTVVKKQYALSKRGFEIFNSYKAKSCQLIKSCQLFVFFEMCDAVILDAMNGREQKTTRSQQTENAETAPACL